MGGKKGSVIAERITKGRLRLHTSVLGRKVKETYYLIGRKHWANEEKVKGEKKG